MWYLAIFSTTSLDPKARWPIPQGSSHLPLRCYRMAIFVVVCFLSRTILYRSRQFLLPPP